jgi:hypothetical protein
MKLGEEDALTDMVTQVLTGLCLVQWHKFYKNLFFVFSVQEVRKLYIFITRIITLCSCLNTTLFLKVKKKSYVFRLAKIAIIRLSMKAIKRKIQHCKD